MKTVLCLVLAFAVAHAEAQKPCKAGQYVQTIQEAKKNATYTCYADLKTCDSEAITKCKKIASAGSDCSYNCDPVKEGTCYFFVKPTCSDKSCTPKIKSDCSISCDSCSGCPKASACSSSTPYILQYYVDGDKCAGLKCLKDLKSCTAMGKQVCQEASENEGQACQWACNYYTK